MKKNKNTGKLRKCLCPRLHGSAHTHTHTHTHIHTHTHAHTHAHTCTHKHTHTHTNTQAHTHTHTSTHTQALSNTHTHTHTNAFRKGAEGQDHRQRQTETDRDRQRQTETDRDRSIVNCAYIASCNIFYSADTGENICNIYVKIYYYKIKNFKSKIIICHENNWLFKILFHDY